MNRNAYVAQLDYLKYMLETDQIDYLEYRKRASLIRQEFRDESRDSVQDTYEFMEENNGY